MLEKLFVSEAFAQSVEVSNSNGAQDFSITSFVPLILIFLVFYFLIVRPQSKKMKDHQTMLNTLKIGNKVTTSGGIVGVVRDIHQKENQVEIEIAPSVNIRILKNYIADLIKEEKGESKKEKAKKNQK